MDYISVANRIEVVLRQERSEEEFTFFKDDIDLIVTYYNRYKQAGYGFLEAARKARLDWTVDVLVEASGCTDE